MTAIDNTDVVTCKGCGLMYDLDYAHKFIIKPEQGTKRLVCPVCKHNTAIWGIE